MRGIFASVKSFVTRRYAQASVLVYLVFVGVFVFVRPVAACGFMKPLACIPAGIALVANLFTGLVVALITIVIEYLIPIMTYNSFSSAPVVTAGWALVRDTVNMFFVIVLIFIAFGTIFGHKKFQWQQQVPKLLLFAIVINFSKTLCGIMIDFGQVVMLTFANALREIAAGNIIELFGLAKVEQITSSGSQVPTSDEWSIAFAAVAGLFLTLWVLVIMILLLAILLYRIVGLWVLIVTAPLAWFAGGAEILGSKAYGQWWEQFKCLVAIGPIVTFFLWLALSVAGAGSAAEGFETSTQGNSANFLTTIFEFQNFMSLIIGSALLMAGMQTAKDFCSAMSGGFLGKTLGKAAAAGPDLAQIGKGAALKAGGWGLRKAGGGIRAAGRGTARYVAPWAENKAGLKLLTKRGQADVLGKIADKSGNSWLGRKAALMAKRKQGEFMGARHAEIGKAGEKFKDDSEETQVFMLQKLLASKPTTQGGQRDLQALMQKLAGSTSMQDTLRAKDPKALAQVFKYGAQYEKDFKGDTKTLKDFEGFKKRNADLSGSQGMIKDWKEVQNLGHQAVGDKEMQKRLSEIRTGIKVQQGVVDDEGKPVYVMDKDGKPVVNKKTGKPLQQTQEVELMADEAIRRGYAGWEKQTIMEKGAKGIHETLADAELRVVNPKDLANNGSANAHARYADLAMRDGDLSRIDQVVREGLKRSSQTTAVDGVAPPTSEERFAIQSNLDQVALLLKAMVESEKAKGPKDSNGVLVNNLQRQLELMNMQRGQETDKMKNLVGRGYGIVPELAGQDKPKEFIEENFKGANKERIDEAKSQVQDQQDVRVSERNEKEDKLKEIIASAVKAIDDKIAELESAAPPDVKAIDDKIAELESAALAEKFGRGDMTKVDAMRKEQDELRTQKSSITEKATEETNEKVDVLKTQKASMTVKRTDGADVIQIVQQLKLDPAATQNAVNLQADIAKLQSEIQKINSAREALDKITPVDGATA